jgi:hypothetical protein
MAARLDRRDQILTRLFTLLGTVSVTISTGTFSGSKLVRNRNELPQEKVPGLILLDADEVKDPRFPELSGRGSRPGPGMMKMTPEVYIVLDQRKPNNILVGEDLNLIRAAVLNLVLHDSALQAFTGQNGLITYDGCVTDLARNRVMQGQMGLSITFSYPFIPDELITA